MPTPLIPPIATTTATTIAVIATATPAPASPTRVSGTPGGTPTNAATPGGGAEAGGIWGSAGSLAQGRAGHTATQLSDGRLLVVGGERGTASGDISLGSAETYDPRTNSWSSAPSMNLGRMAHTATTLPDGRILVVGGDAIQPGQPPTSTGSVELYDPRQNGWQLGPAMSTGREHHTATLLPTGRVLVTGGETKAPGSTEGRAVASAELYDPATNTWSPAGDLSMSRVGHTATLLPDGRVVIVGGVTEGADGRREVTAAVEVYDTRTGQWSQAGDLTTGRTDHTATLLPDGRIMVVGGETAETRGSGAQFVGAGSRAIPSATTEIFDPTSGRWSPLASLGSPRSGHTTTLLPTGQLLVAGGYGQGSGQPLSIAERYDLASGTWSALPMASARASHTATLLADGSLILVGGRGTGGSYIAQADRLPSRGVVPTPTPTTGVPPIVPTATATATPIPRNPSAPPTATPTPSRPPASAAPSPSPTAVTSPPPAPSPSPSVAPPPSTVPLPSPEPSAAPSVAPSPSPLPSAAPSPSPSPSPSPPPSVAPSAPPAPSPSPSPAPSAPPRPTPTPTATTVVSRPGTVYGIVQGCTGGACFPLTGVVVSAAGLSTRTSQGSYALANVPSGAVTVTVSGAVNGSKTVTVPPGGRVEASFTLDCKDATSCGR